MVAAPDLRRGSGGWFDPPDANGRCGDRTAVAGRPGAIRRLTPGHLLPTSLGANAVSGFPAQVGGSGMLRPGGGVAEWLKAAVC